MSLAPALFDPILYQNKDRTTTLIDIPLSISSSQCTPNSQCTQVLYSTPPLEKPYPSIEPRTEKAREKVQRHLSPGDLAQQSFLQGLLVQGLAEIRAERSRPFCYMRKICPLAPTHNNESWGDNNLLKAIERTTAEPKLDVPSLDSVFFSRRASGSERPLILPASALSSGHEPLHMTSLMSRVISNPSPHHVRIQASDTGAIYRIPPLSTFTLSKVGRQEATDFSSAAYKIFPEPSVTAAPGQFDFILLDPPWENKSVRRSKKYQTRRKVEEGPLSVLQDMLGKHIGPGAIVACWITNKESARTAALKTLETWGVDVIEEWVWLKTTVHGEPICDIGGIMRRPYETLLVGRASYTTSDDFGDPGSGISVTKRLIVGVPDLHSRKPCLKALIEPMMRDKSTYRALEIFARHLTAGWWSWGDEVLKYNWEGHWTEAGVEGGT